MKDLKDDGELEGIRRVLCLNWNGGVGAGEDGTGKLLASRARLRRGSRSLALPAYRCSRYASTSRDDSR